ncbi:MAG TPA: hypothetical protein VH595_20665 [Verrucomicrobiae bacterium]|nr:hypothetical protein [Verrucomicrobiae bacterium]
MTKIENRGRRLLEHRGFPMALALAAVVLMLPSLQVGLTGDDLIQRLNQFPPDQLPSRILDTGFVAKGSGQLGTVLGNLFGYVHGKEAAIKAMDYGIAPWWASEGWTASLWRPVTAFTHWFDYRLYPNSPGLMHAQNIAWFALAVLLVAKIYRRIEASMGKSAGAVAGLAGCLWLLDKDTYCPVAYVANRGFFIALVFGLLCWHAHVRWRTEKSWVWMWLSALCLLLSVLADEGGASTLAFLLAYAIVLEAGGWRPRLVSLLPAILVIIGWRAVYVGCGFGVRNFPGYVDPEYSPLVFLKDIFPRMNALLGGQLTGLPPELAMALNAKCQMILALLFAAFSLICAVVFWRVVRRDAVARFWAVMMLLALVPAATVAPLSKNLGFVAVGAFGVMASFLAGFARRRERAAMAGPLRVISWCVAVCLVGAHVAGAIGARIVMGLGSRSVPKWTAMACDYEPSLDIGERDIVVINDPTIASAIVPFYRAYRGEPLPRSTRILVPGSVPFEVTRTDASTLILRAKESDLFDCPDLGPIQLCYACKSYNDFVFGGLTWKKGDRVRRKGFVAEILEVSPRGEPRSMAFRFEKPLEADGRVWLFFDWHRGGHRPFVLPRIGETVAVAGPRMNFGRIIEEHLAP